MISLHSEEMRSLIKFTIRRYRLSLPKDLSMADFEQEVSINLFKFNGEIGTTEIVNQVIWTRSRVWKEFLSRSKVELKPEKSHSENKEYLYAKEAIDRIIALEDLSDQERQLLSLMRRGFTTAKIRDKMNIRNRQRFEQIKKTAFFKVRTLCPTAAYWR